MEPEDLDAFLRATLAHHPAAVERVIRGALSASESALRRRPLLRASGLAALFAVLALALSLGLEKLRPLSSPGRPAISIANVGEIVVADSPAGAWLVRMGDSAPQRPSGTIIVTFGGEQ